ncbi:MAG: CDP-alcohol phosphatidyltransferase family protein [Candidatus Shapirobacteria bacterium]|nr:CDP-alcohol phosphatidyltransferase family protein [Candidatus Shapirobacteria bacterium]
MKGEIFMAKFELAKFFDRAIMFSPDKISRVNHFQKILWRLENSKSIIWFGVCLKKIFYGKVDTSPHVILMVPNLLSLFRLIAILIIFTVGSMVGIDNKWFFIVTYLMLMAIDLIDGPIARQTGTVSELGMFLDPVADKVCHLSVILIAVDFKFIPVWFLMASMIKELVSGMICARRNIGSARWFAKIASLLELIILLLAFLISIPNLVFVLLIIIQILVLIAYATIKI